MKLRLELAQGVTKVFQPLLRAQLAYCHPGILGYDLSGAAEGVLELDCDEQACPKTIRERVQALVEQLTRGAPEPPQKILRRLPEREVAWDGELDQRLRALGWLKNCGSGAYLLHGPLAVLQRYFDRCFRRLCVERGAEEAHFPALLPTDFLRRIDYFQSFPQYTTFAAHLQPDVDTIKGFMARAREPHTPFRLDADEMAQPSMILSPTVCYHAYESLTDAQLQGDTLWTATCACYRWESANMEHLRRLWEFTMREGIFLGSKAYVLAERQAFLDATLSLCEAWGLQGWVENANDPFFSPDAASKSAYQLGFEMKWELRLPVDAAGASLAVSSFNNMQKTFGTSCGITQADGQEAFSGCAGWGLERWVYAFVAQHGVDFARWPEQVRRGMEEL